MSNATMSIIPAESINAIQAQTEANQKLLRELIVNGRKLNPDQLVGRAAFAALYGLDPVSEVNTIVNASGQTMSHSMHINGFRRKCDEQVDRELPGARVMMEFIELPDEKLPAEAYVGYECRLRDGSSQDAWTRNMTKIGRQLREILGPNLTYADLKEACGPSPVYSGIGIVYKSEVNNGMKDTNFNPFERAKKRAERNARGRRFTINAPIYDGDGQPVVNEDAIDGEFKESQDDGEAIVGKNSIKRPENVILTDLGFAPGGYTREDYARELSEAQAKTAAEVAQNAPAGLDGKVADPVLEGAETSSEDLDAQGLDEDGNLEGEQGWISLEDRWPGDASMSYNLAASLAGKDKDGNRVRYVDMTTEQIGRAFAAVEDRLKDKSKLSEKQIDDLSLRLDALRIIRLLG